MNELQRELNSLSDELRDLWGGGSDEDTSSSRQTQKQQRALEKHSQEAQELLKEERKLRNHDLKRRQRNPKYFSVYGALMGGLAVLGMISVFLPNIISLEFIGVLSVLVMALATVSTFRKLQYNPLGKLDDKIDRLYSRWMEDLKATETETVSAPTARRHRTRAPSRYHGQKRNNRMIAGVASTLADKLGIDVSIIRLILVGFLFFSGGSIIPLYFIAAFILSMSENNSSPDKKLN